MSVIRFGPLTDEQELVWSAMYEGDDFPEDTADETISLAGTLLALAEPHLIDVLDDGSRTFMEPHRPLSEWDELGLFLSLREANCGYHAAGDGSGCSWWPGEAAETQQSRMAVVAIPMRSETVMDALALTWSSMMENDPRITATENQREVTIARVVLKHVALSDIESSDAGFQFPVVADTPEEWEASELCRALMRVSQRHSFTPFTDGGLKRVFRWDHVDGARSECVDGDGEPCLTFLDWLDLHADNTEDAVVAASASRLGVLAPAETDSALLDVQ